MSKLPSRSLFENIFLSITHEFNKTHNPLKIYVPYKLPYKFSEKLKAFQNGATPKTLDELKKFVGLVM